jgi:hypothetical protein
MCLALSRMYMPGFGWDPRIEDRVLRRVPSRVVDGAGASWRKWTRIAAEAEMRPGPALTMKG